MFIPILQVAGQLFGAAFVALSCLQDPPAPPEPGLGEALGAQSRVDRSAAMQSRRFRVQYRADSGANWQDYLETRSKEKADTVAKEMKESGYQAQVVNDQTPAPQPYPDQDNTSASGYYPASNYASDYNTYLVPGGNYGYTSYSGWNPGYRHYWFPGYWNGGSSWGWGGGWWGGHGWHGGWHRGYHWHDGWHHGHRSYNHSHANRGTHYAHHERHANQAHHAYNNHRNTAGHHMAGHHAAAHHATSHTADHRGTGHHPAGARNGGRRAGAHSANGHAFRGGRGGGGRGNSAGRNAAGAHGRHLDP